jgi:hypothetical protein
MKHEHAERAVKALQKSFLYWLEEREEFATVRPNGFNALRKEVFKLTFTAYRQGVVGIDPNCKHEVKLVWDTFSPSFDYLSDGDKEVFVSKFLAVLLVCFRLGAAVGLKE